MGFQIRETSLRARRRRSLSGSRPAKEVALAPTTGEERWTLQEIRAGRPLITAATQDKFVPQMVNFDELGAVDFRKGCYPGQEIVAARSTAGR